MSELYVINIYKFLSQHIFHTDTHNLLLNTRVVCRLPRPCLSYATYIFRFEETLEVMQCIGLDESRHAACGISLAFSTELCR